MEHFIHEWKMKKGNQKGGPQGYKDGNEKTDQRKSDLPFVEGQKYSTEHEKKWKNSCVSIEKVIGEDSYTPHVHGVERASTKSRIKYGRNQINFCEGICLQGFIRIGLPLKG